MNMWMNGWRGKVEVMDRSNPQNYEVGRYRASSGSPSLQWPTLQTPGHTEGFVLTDDEARTLIVADEKNLTIGLDLLEESGRIVSQYRGRK